jgi:hypothetical protein
MVPQLDIILLIMVINIISILVDIATIMDIIIILVDIATIMDIINI